MLIHCRAIVKAALPEEPTTIKDLNRERASYCLVSVYLAACFRRICDVLNITIIALEWLDTTLAGVDLSLICARMHLSKPPQMQSYQWSQRMRTIPD